MINNQPNSKFTIRTLFLIILFCGIFYLSLRPIIDPDFWWHLRTGQLIAQTKEIPRVDPFSFTANGREWITHEWLSELFIFNLYQLGSYELLIFIFSGIITASLFFAYLNCPKASKPYIAGFSVLLGAISSGPIWGVRPQIFTFLFTGIFLFLLDRFRLDRNIRWLIPIPLVMVLWVNLHAGYIIGIGIEVIYLVGYILEVLSFSFKRKEMVDGETKRSLWILFSVIVISLFASLLNPVGLRILTYPFQTLTDPAMQAYIQEWMSPDFHNVIWLPFAVMILALIGLGMAGNRPISITKTLLTLIFGFGALRSMRNVALFAIVVIPVLADQLSYLIKLKLDLQKPGRLFRWIAIVLICVIVLVVTLGFIKVIDDQPKSVSESYPEAAVDWTVENKPESKIFNSYNWGGYLIWRLYPDYLVYIDGRADLYGAEFVTEFFSIYSIKPGWEEKLDQENIRMVFIESDSVLANALRRSATWNIEFEDDLSVIFEKN